jgi:ribosomal protein L6P/L9E
MIFFSLCFNLINFCSFKKCYKSFILLDKKGSVSLFYIKQPLKLFIYKQFLSATMFSNIANTYKKHLLISFKQLLLNKISLFSVGCKDQIVVKGLGFKCSFITIKNRLFLIFKLNYSHKITVPIQFEIYNVCFKKDSVVLLESGNKKQLSLLLGLLFRLKPKNVYRENGVFFRRGDSFVSKPNKKKA